MTLLRVAAICQNCLEEGNVYVIRLSNEVALGRLARRHLIDEHRLEPHLPSSLEINGPDGVFYRS